MATKWFYAAQSEAEEQLRNIYSQCFCNYQLVTRNRVINNYTCANSLNSGEPSVTMEIVLVKHGSNVSAFIYEMKYLQGWQTNK